MAALLSYYTHCQQKVQSDREETLHGPRSYTQSHSCCARCSIQQFSTMGSDQLPAEHLRLCHRVMCETHPHIVSVKAVSHPDIWNGECHCCARDVWLIAGTLHLLLLSCCFDESFQQRRAHSRVNMLSQKLQGVCGRALRRHEGPACLPAHR